MGNIVSSREDLALFGVAGGGAMFSVLFCEGVSDWLVGPSVTVLLGAETGRGTLSRIRN